MHLRGDRRHIKDRDVELLRQVVATKLNVEMAATAEMTAIALRVRPDQVTLVPEQPHEVTTQGGLDVTANRADVAEADRASSARTASGSASSSIRTRRRWRRRRTSAPTRSRSTPALTPTRRPRTRGARLAEVQRAADAAAAAGLEVLAGHGLTYVNIHPVAAIREIEELNIGHSIISRASLVGLDRAVREMVALLK